MIRFWNDDLLLRTDMVIEQIYEALVRLEGRTLSPALPLKQGEGDNALNALSLCCLLYTSDAADE